jgi:hypothetical protein
MAKAALGAPMKLWSSAKAEEEILENWSPGLKDIQNQKNQGTEPETSLGWNWRYRKCENESDWESCMFGE